MRYVMVCSSLLRDPLLPPSAKLVWMATRMLGEEWRNLTITAFGEKIKLNPKTVQRALSVLEKNGWTLEPRRCVANPSQHECKQVPVPVELIQDARLSARARVLYPQLQLTAGFKAMSGQFTYAELREAFGIDPRTARSAIWRLMEAGWLRTTQRSTMQPVYFQMCNPFAEAIEAELFAVKRRLRKADFLGEALMREILSLVVDSTEFEDDAHPGFLVHPATGERLQLDRYYPPRVAFEFNGPQHYGTTDWYPDKDAFIAQRVRDLVKIGLCVDNKVDIIIVHPEDLSIDTMRHKVGDRLPQRDLSGLERIVSYVEARASRYRKSSAGRQLPKRPPPSGQR